MLARFHRRRVVTLAACFLLLTGLLLFFMLDSDPSNLEKWGVILQIAFGLAVFGIAVIVEWNKLRKIETVEVPRSRSGVLDASEIVMKCHSSVLDEYWMFEPSGAYLGMVRPRFVWLLYPVYWLMRGEEVIAFFFGLSYEILDGDERLIGRLKWKRGLKTVVNIFDARDNLLGTYRQDDWKSLKSPGYLHGELLNQDGQNIFDTKVHFRKGNFALVDCSGIHWASLEPDSFPQEYRKIFVDSLNPLIRINPGLAKEERVLLLAMVPCWFLQIRRL